MSAHSLHTLNINKVFAKSVKIDNSAKRYIPIAKQIAGMFKIKKNSLILEKLINKSFVGEMSVSTGYI